MFFDATAEYYRSDESSVPFCRSCFGRCMRGAEHRTLQGAAAHPAIGASPAGGTRRGRARNSRASSRIRRPTGAGTPNAFPSHYGPVLGLGPLSSQPCGWGTVERAAPSFVTSPASRRGDACSSWSRHLRGGHSPEPLRGFLLRAFHRGVRLQAADNGAENRSQR